MVLSEEMEAYIKRAAELAAAEAFAKYFKNCTANANFSRVEKENEPHLHA